MKALDFLMGGSAPDKPNVDHILAAMGRVESGGKYDIHNTEGDLGYGKYQFQPETWDSWSKEYSQEKWGRPTKLEPNPQNQEAVARWKVENLVNKGWGVREIAAYWNSGKPTTHYADGRPKVGVNKRNVKFDVPGHVAKVEKAYKAFVPEYAQDKPGAQAFLTEEEPSIFSVSSVYAAETPGTGKGQSAEAFLLGDDTAGSTKPAMTAEDFLLSEDEPGVIANGLNTAKDALTRGAGVVLGTFNAPHAFSMGGFKAANENPEEWAKLPFWKKVITATGGGFDAAWKSITEEGSWGADVDDFSKFTTGKTIEEHLPEGKAKLLAPTIKFLGSLMLDPVVTVGAAQSIIRKIGTREVFGELAKTMPKTPELQTVKVPQGVLDDIAALEKLDDAEKAQVRQQLLDILKGREDYARRVTNWGDETLNRIEAWERNPPIKRGESMFPRVAGEAGEIAKPAISPTRQAARPLTPDELARLDVSGREVEEISKRGQNPLKSEKGAVRLPSTKQQQHNQALSQNPNWSKVNGMIGEEQSGFSIGGLWAAFNTKFLDRFAPIRGMAPATYEEARKFSSYKDVAKGKFDELADSLKPVKDSEYLFTDYVLSHRALDRARRGIKNPNSVTLTDAQGAIAEIERHYKASGKDPQQLRGALQGFKDWTHDSILKPLLDSGVLSRQAYKEIVQKNRWYATFDVLERLPDDINKIPALPSKEFFSVSNQNVIKGMVGTTKKIRNPIEATVKKFMDSQALAARNRVASTFVDEVLTGSNPDLIRPVAESAKEFQIMKNQGLNPVMKGAWNKKEFDAVNRFKNGEVERYIAPKEIADALKQLSPYQAPKVVQALNGIFRSSATTLYLPFTISNTMRDALMAYSTAPVYRTSSGGKFAADWVKGFWEGLKQEFGPGSALVKEYLESGGGFGYVGEVRTAKLARSQLFKKSLPAKGLNVITSPFKLIEKMSAAVELAPRIGTYSRAKTSGFAAGDAAMIARDATIDFSRGGQWTKVANQFVPFLNARVQGRVKVIEALKNDRKNTLSKIFISAVVPGVAAYAWNRLNHSDLYDDIPEHIRQNYFVLITGTTQEKGKTVPRYLVFAKGDLGQMAMNPLEYGFDRMWEKDREGMGKFLVNYLNDLSPVDFAREGEVSLSKAAGSVLPPIVKGLAEDWANLNLYSGREVVPYYMGKNKPPELQYKDNTPESYKWLGEKLGISPLRLQNFAGNILAGYGREGLDPSAMMRGLTGRLIKTTGGSKEDKAWLVIKDIENGYEYTRAYAQEMMKNGNRDEAVRLMSEWNKGLIQRIHEVDRYGLKDRGGLQRDYRFTPEKQKKILMQQREDPRSPLERKLSVR